MAVRSYGMAMAVNVASMPMQYTNARTAHAQATVATRGFRPWPNRGGAESGQWLLDFDRMRLARTRVAEAPQRRLLVGLWMVVVSLAIVYLALRFGWGDSTENVLPSAD